MSECKTHCSCGRRIADNMELRGRIDNLERYYSDASDACNKVAAERDKTLQTISTQRQQLMVLAKTIKVAHYHVAPANPCDCEACAISRDILKEGN